MTIYFYEDFKRAAANLLFTPHLFNRFALGVGSDLWLGSSDSIFRALRVFFQTKTPRRFKKKGSEPAKRKFDPLLKLLYNS